jgi:AcrR family transcriptional regulator
MGARARAAQLTREQILDAAVELFTSRSFDDVTISDIASRAEVSGQTITNHFGSKDNLYITGLEERFAPRVNKIRSGVAVGDVESIVGVVVAGYEETGESTVQMMAQSNQFEALAEATRRGRKAHEDWVFHVFSAHLETVADPVRGRLHRMLCVLLDVYTWHQLRTQDGLSDKEVRDHLTFAIEALLQHS